MLAFAMKVTQDEDDAKEIVQDMFKSLWERRNQLSLEDPERYIFRSVKLKTMEFIRNKSIRKRHHNLIISRSEIGYEDHHVQVNELHVKVKHVIDSLPRQCKNVFKMSREEGLTNKEIAKMLLISERAVEYHISRALSTLKLSLAQER